MKQLSGLRHGYELGGHIMQSSVIMSAPILLALLPTYHPDGLNCIWMIGVSDNHALAIEIWMWYRGVDISTLLNRSWFVNGDWFCPRAFWLLSRPNL